MQSTFFRRVAMASALMLAFSACGDDASGGPDFDDTATTEDTELMADAARNLAGHIMDQVDFGHPDLLLSLEATVARVRAEHPFTARSPLGARLVRGMSDIPGLVAVPGAPLQLVAAPGCSITSHGSEGDPFDPYDGNENGIPDDWAVAYTCIVLDTSDASNTVTHRLRIEISAKENSASLHGYTSHQLYEEKAFDEEGNEEGELYEGEERLDIRAGLATRNGGYHAREWSSIEGVTYEGLYSEMSDASFDPASAISLESPLPNGDLVFTGKRTYWETDDTSLSFSLDTPVTLAFNSECWYTDNTPAFSSGALRGRLNGNGDQATFTVTFNSCGNYTVVTDNTEDLPAAPRI